MGPQLPPLRTVLVPVDGTQVAEHALPYALALARRAGAEVALAHVHSAAQAAREPDLLGWHGGQYLVGPARDYLEVLAARLAEAHPVRVRPVLLKGFWPEDPICDLGDRAADLVVMTARRRGWWSRFWSGSVSTQVAHRSRVPVLLVPAPEAPADVAVEPSLSRVLVPLDGSTRAERALGPASALAALSDGGCELLHVVRSRPYAVDWSLAFGGPSTGTPVAETLTARRYLRGVARRLRASDVPTRVQIVADERPTAEAIARYAGSNGTDVIAIANRGGVGLRGLFGWSTAARVARRAPAPVLICRAR